MKKIALIAALGLMGMGSAMAQTANGNFNVTATLTSACQMTTVTPVLAFGTYTAFSATALVATPVTLAFRCTRGTLPAITVAFDVSANGTSSVTGATATGEGVIAGLRYTMAAAAATAVVAGNAPVVATLGDIGTPATRQYVISGNMPLGQAGTAAAGLQTAPRSLIVTF